MTPSIRTGCKVAVVLVLVLVAVAVVLMVNDSDMFDVKT